MKHLSDALLQALDRPDIMPHVRREVYNAVFGVHAIHPTATAWKSLLAEVRTYMRHLRSNKKKLRTDLLDVWQDYYDVVSGIPTLITNAYKQDKTAPVPDNLRHWQNWIDPEVRAVHIRAFALVYDANPRKGMRLVPFAPQTLRRETYIRIERLLTAIRTTREHWNTAGDPATPTKPRSDTHLGAVILAATFQAERAVRAYKRKLDNYLLHPFETPLKMNWQHYCDAETREKVRRLSANPADVYFEFDGYLPFYKEH